MIKRATAVLVSAALGVGVALAAVSLSGASPPDLSKVTFNAVTLGTFTTDVQGTINSRARPNGSIRLLASLHSLAADTSYELTGNRKPCSVVDAADYVVWSQAFKTASDDDVFATTRTQRELPGKVRSVRLGIVIDALGGNDEVACSRALALQHATQNESKERAAAP